MCAFYTVRMCCVDSVCGEFFNLHNFLMHGLERSRILAASHRVDSVCSRPYATSTAESLK